MLPSVAIALAAIVGAAAAFLAFGAGKAVFANELGVGGARAEEAIAFRWMAMGAALGATVGAAGGTLARLRVETHVWLVVIGAAFVVAAAASAFGEMLERRFLPRAGYSEAAAVEIGLLVVLGGALGAAAARSPRAGLGALLVAGAGGVLAFEVVDTAASTVGLWGGMAIASTISAVAAVVSLRVRS